MIKRLLKILFVVVALLSIPLIAMQFSDEVDWDLTDFIIMGILLFGTGVALDWALTRSKNKHRLLIASAIVLTFLLIWVELAVGIFGSPVAGS